VQQLLLSCEVTLKYKLKDISPPQRSIIRAYKNILLQHGSLKVRNPGI